MTRPAKKATPPAKKAAPAKSTTPAAPPRATPPAMAQTPGEAVILRRDRAPENQLDLTDRQDTRVTSDDRTLERETRYRRDQTRQNWHRVWQDLTPAVVWTVLGLGGTVVLAVLYVAIVVALQRLLPALTVEQDMWIAGAAITAALGGSGLRVAGQALAARYGRGRGGGAPPT